MLISVLVTTWGCGDYLEPCRKSIAVARGECPIDVEVIELSDGSGVWNARNELIRRARGDWLCFVDGDDRLEPGALERLASVVASDPAADLVTFRLVEEREWDGRVGRPAHPFPRNWSACAYHRRVLPPGGFASYALGEDVLFLMQCLCRARHIVDVESVFYRYVRHFGSASMQGDYGRLFHSKLGYVQDWFAELAGASPTGRSNLRDLGRARRMVIRDLLGSAALDLAKMDPRPWGDWYGALDRIARFSQLLPLDARLELFLCRCLRWHWVTFLICNLGYRLRMKLSEDRV